MEVINEMINVISAFGIAPISYLFGQEIVFALGLKYSGQDEWLEYLFEAYLDCKQMAVAMATA